MNFLAMLIALALQQVISPHSMLQSRGWLSSWDAFVGRSVRGAGRRLAAVLASVGFAGYWILDTAEGWIFGLPMLLICAGMLLWSLGWDDYHTALERFDARRESDPSAALDCLDRLWMPPGETGQPERSEEAAALGQEAAEDLAHRHLLYAGYARWFGPLFYFALTGPLGAVIYRCVASIAADRPEAVNFKALAVLDWAPSRVLVVTFAITGNFLEVMERLGREHLWRGASAPELLGAAARSACSNAPGPRVGADLLYRSSGFWLIVLSLLFVFA